MDQKISGNEDSSLFNLSGSNLEGKIFLDKRPMLFKQVIDDSDLLGGQGELLNNVVNINISMIPVIFC